MIASLQFRREIETWALHPSEGAKIVQATPRSRRFETSIDI